MPMRNHLSSLLFFLLVLLYFSGFYQAVQSSVISAMILTLLLPVLFWRLVKPVDNQAEITRILLLESGFNLLCVVALLHLLPLAVMDKAFMVFFVLQAGGFLLVQSRKKAWLSFAVSVCLSFVHLGLDQPSRANPSTRLRTIAVVWHRSAVATKGDLHPLVIATVVGGISLYFAQSDDTAGAFGLADHCVASRGFLPRSHCYRQPFLVFEPLF